MEALVPVQLQEQQKGGNHNMAIVFQYQPISTFKEGFDAIQEYQRLKLSKAMAALQVGSQFGDPTAIAQGLEQLGLKDTAQKYYDVADKAKAARFEAGKQTATEAALKEMYGDNVSQALAGRIDKAGKVDVNANTTVSKGVEKKQEDIYKQAISGNAPNPAVEAAYKELYGPNVQTALKNRIDKIAKDTTEVSGDVREKQLDLYQKAISGEAPSAVENINLGKISPASISKMPVEALSNPDNIEKIVYSAEDMPTAKARLATIAKTLSEKTGGLDVGTVLQLQNIEEGLNRLYGHDYKSATNWAALMKRSGGGSSGGHDYAVVDNEGNTYYIAAPSAEQAQQIATKRFGKVGAVFKGTMEEVQKAYNDWYQEVLTNEVKAKTIGAKVYNPWIGEPRLVDTNTGEELTEAEIKKRWAKNVAPKMEINLASIPGITAIKNSRKK